MLFIKKKELHLYCKKKIILKVMVVNFFDDLNELQKHVSDNINNIKDITINKFTTEKYILKYIKK